MSGHHRPQPYSWLSPVSAATSPTIRHGEHDPAALATGPALTRARITRLRIVEGLCLIDTDGGEVALGRVVPRSTA